VGGPLLAGWMTRNGMAPAWFGVRLTAGSIGALVTAFVAGVAVAVLSVAVVSVRAGRIRPTEALREAALEHRTMGWPRWLAGGAALAGAVLLLLGLVLLFPSGGTDLKTDVTLALLAIGGTALLAPVLLRPLARLATRPLRSRAGGVLVRARVLTGSRRAAAAVAPVLITVGIAATVLGSTDTSDAAKNTELHRQAATADFVVLPAGTGGLLDQTVARLRAVPGVRASAITDTSVLANAPEVTSLHLEPPTPIPFPAIGVDSAGALRFGVTSGSLDAVSDSTVAVDAGWGRRVGDSMKLWLADGTPVNLRVVAVFDSGLGGTSLVLSQRNAGRALPDRMYLRLDPGADRTAVQDALQDAARTGGARVVPSDRWAAAVSDRQAAQTRLGLVVLLGIAIAYSGIGIANTFLMAVSAQRRELALLRLSGASRRQVLSVVLGESTLLACAGIVLAALVSVVVLGGLDTAFARLVGATPVVLPRVLTGAIAGGGIVLALVATAIPALLILRRRPIELVGIRE
ncbi:MAG TPA: ABC transporter permease, partial [Rugosimonospora sp.]|nr:ABC transporter permease [Rugosimonospora sp.]